MASALRDLSGEAAAAGSPSTPGRSGHLDVEEGDGETVAVRGSPVIGGTPAAAAASAALPPARSASPLGAGGSRLGGVAGAVMDDLEEDDEEEEEEVGGGGAAAAAGAAAAQQRQAAAASQPPPTPTRRGRTVAAAPPHTPSAPPAYQHQQAPSPYADVPSRYLLPPSPRPPQRDDIHVVVGTKPLPPSGLAEFLDRQAAAAEAMQPKVLAILHNDMVAEGGAGMAADAMCPGSRAILERKEAAGVQRHAGVGGLVGGAAAAAAAAASSVDDSFATPSGALSSIPPPRCCQRRGAVRGCPRPPGPPR